MNSTPMIETEFFILTPEQFEEYSQYAAVEGVNVDYYLSEFCDVEGPYITAD